MAQKHETTATSFDTAASTEVGSLVGFVLHPDVRSEDSVAAFRDAYVSQSGGEQPYAAPYALLECTEDKLNGKGERVLTIVDHNAGQRVITDVQASILMVATETSRGPGVSIDDNPKAWAATCPVQGGPLVA